MTGCNKKDEKQNPFNPASEIEPKESLTQETLKAEESKQEHNTTILQPVRNNTFYFSDIKEQEYTVSIEKKQLFFNDISQPIVIINFFSPWSLPCKAQVPYLSDLQKKYPKKLFILGILLNPKDHKETLGTFIQKNHANYYISCSKENNAFTKKILKQLHLPDIMPIPLTVIYQNGQHYRHYEGAVPIEMIEHDVKILIESRNDR